MLLGLVFLISLSVFPASTEDTLTQEAVYARCYLQVVRSRPPSSDDIRNQVIQGKLSATDACLKLISDADLSTEKGEVKKLTEAGASGDSKKRALDILKTFNDVHRSWFSSDSYFRALPQGECFNATSAIHDPAQPALYFTHSLFRDGASASDIVTLPYALMAVRQRPDPASTTPELPAPYGDFSNFPFVAGLGAVDQTAPLWADTTNLIVPKGRLVGVTSSKSAMIPALPAGPDVTDLYAHPTFDVKKSAGGGLLGSPAFMLLNLGRDMAQPIDGGRIVPRRWSVAILRDILCRDLPAIRSGDVIDKLEPGQFPNAPLFRSSTSCMQCHSTIDNMAGVARNFIMNPAVFAKDPCPNGGSNSMHMRALSVSGGSGKPILLSSPSVTYSQTPPMGRLYYRSFSGELIDQEITGVDQLGQALAQKDDLYVCTAKKYYAFFTGISVSLQDLGDPLSSALSAKDLEQRNLVIQWGQELKKTQNVKQLLRRIFDSPAYQKRHYGMGQ